MSNHFSERLRLDYLLEPFVNIDDGQDVITGLSHKPQSLPPRYFYDDRGSLLFEEICNLPEYYPTRTEAAILTQYASEIAKLTGDCELVELGSGSSTKTRLLLDAYANLGLPLRYLPIDVSPSILENSAKQLLTDYSSLEIHGIIATYADALTHLGVSPVKSRMILFLGSTLGNLTPLECDRFFKQVTTALLPGDYFLLGIDLQKPVAILEAAYNDSQQITAAFNLNMLSHLNWQFDGNFDLNCFRHRAIYNQEQAQIEMYLDCVRSHNVQLNKLNLSLEFQENTSILTEISRKFDLEQMQQYLHTQGLQSIKTWTDPQSWFAVVLTQLKVKI